MYDKVKLWLPRLSDTPDFTLHLERAKQQTDLNTGEVSGIGNLGCMKIIAYASGYTIVGSLPKFLYGNNIVSLDLHDTAIALEKLSDGLQYDCSRARVIDLEFGTNFPMSKPVGEYFKNMGGMSRMLRCQFDEKSLYYRPRGKRQSKICCFYDKKAESIKKGAEIPVGIEDGNLLRYELRLNGMISRQIGIPVDNVRSLSDVNVFNRLIQMWQQAYFSIERNKILTLDNMNEIKTVSDAFNCFVAILMQQSDRSQIQAYMDELKQAGVFADRKNYTRLKKKFKSVCENPSFSISDEVIKELDEAVRDVGINNL